jgi:hypothetical protein
VTDTDDIERHLGNLMADLTRANQRDQLKEIEANPEAHRLTRLMAPGKRADYSCFRAGERQINARKRELTHMCRATNKNASGVYLIWREVHRQRLVRGKWKTVEARRLDFQWAPKELARRKAAGLRAAAEEAR